MRVIREIDLGGKTVQVKELTVGEVRQWLASKESPGDVVDSLLFEEIALSDFAFLTDLDAAAVDALTLSEIEKLLAVAKEVNAAFFAMRERAVALGQRILAEQAPP
jgi:hypothetical protein